MTIEEMKAKKLEFGLTNEQLAEAAGIPLGTLQKIFAGITKAPRRQTVEAVERALAQEAARRSYLAIAAAGKPAGYVKESGVSYGAVRREDRRFTLEDYYALPDDIRVELIDGVFYDMATPSHLHQMILGELHLLFRKCTDEHNVPCDVWLAPSDVRLDRDDFTMVQPDLFVVCSREYDHPNRLEGAPDLAVEILSPSTRSKDMGLKLFKYWNAGVREYWVVDPKNRSVAVYCFNGEDCVQEQYSFSDTVPVHISDGTCSIDFSGILKYSVACGV